MTKLEQDIFDAVHKVERYDEEGEAQAAADVAKRYIAEAVTTYHTKAQYFLQSQGFLNNTALDLIHRDTKEWLKETGVISDTKLQSNE